MGPGVDRGSRQRNLMVWITFDDRCCYRFAGSRATNRQFRVAFRTRAATSDVHRSAMHSVPGQAAMQQSLHDNAQGSLWFLTNSRHPLESGTTTSTRTATSGRVPVEWPSRIHLYRGIATPGCYAPRRNAENSHPPAKSPLSPERSSEHGRALSPTRQTLPLRLTAASGHPRENFNSSCRRQANLRMSRSPPI